MTDIDNIRDEVTEHFMEPDEDVLPTLIICKDGQRKALTSDVKQFMHVFVKRVKNEDLDWAAFFATSYAKTDFDKEEAEQYKKGEYGSLADDPDAEEIQMIQIWTPEKKVGVILDKHTLDEIERIDDSDDDAAMDGYLSM